VVEPTKSSTKPAVLRLAAISCVKIAGRPRISPDNGPLPTAPLHCSEIDGFAVMRVWPDAWLLSSDTLTPSILLARAEELADRSASLVVDVSDFYEAFDIEGRAARDVIASGCAVDFETSTPPMATAARLSHFDVIIIFRAPERFRVLIARSYADDLEEWLIRAAKYAHMPDSNGATQ